MPKYIRATAIAGLIASAAVLGGCVYEPGYYGPRYAYGGPYAYAPYGYYGGGLSFSYYDHDGWGHRHWDHDRW